MTEGSKPPGRYGAPTPGGPSPTALAGIGAVVLGLLVVLVFVFDPFGWTRPKAATGPSVPQRTVTAVLKLEGHTDAVRRAVFSPDGTMVLTASVDGTARLWDAATGKAIRTVTIGDPLTWAAFAPGGASFVTGGSNGDARVWETKTGKLLARTGGQASGVYSAEFSPDGKRIVVASDDGTAKEYDALTGDEMLVLKGHTDRVLNAAFSPDGRRIATGSGDSTARIWNTFTGALEHTFSASRMGEVNAVAWSPDGRLLLTASYDGYTRAWDTTTGKQHDRTMNETSDRQGVSGQTAFGVSISPDGKFAATAAASQSGTLWERQGAGFEFSARFKAHDNATYCANFSPDGQRIVTSGDDGVAIIWKIAEPAAKP